MPESRARSLCLGSIYGGEKALEVLAQLAAWLQLGSAPLAHYDDKSRRISLKICGFEAQTKKGCERGGGGGGRDKNRKNERKMLSSLAFSYRAAFFAFFQSCEI